MEEASQSIQWKLIMEPGAVHTSETIYTIKNERWKLINHKWVKIGRPIREESFDPELRDRMEFDLAWFGLFLYISFLFSMSFSIIHFGEVEDIFLTNHLPVKYY